MTAAALKVTVFLCVLLLLSACFPETPDRRSELESVRLRAFITELEKQNSALYAQNQKLQQRLIRYQSGFVSENETLQDCLAELQSVVKQTKALPSPADWIPLKRILVYGDRVVINISGTIPVVLNDTHSMEPIADATATVLAIRPKRARDINIGDIIGYRCDECDGQIIMHRVIAISQDIDGIYYTVKGDNNPKPDPDRVRFSQVETVVVGIIY